MLSTSEVLGVPIARLAPEAALLEAKRLYEDAAPAMVAYVNVHTVSLAAEDPTYAEVLRDADLLIHDAMHADHDYELRKGWGHSPARAGVVVAERAGAKKLALFHHSPDATDDMIDEVVARTAAQTAVPVFAAAEGSYLDI